MAKTLRIVRSDWLPVIGVCEFCNMQVKSSNPNLLAAGEDVKAQFDGHKCKLTDSSQNALRIVREATEDK